MSWSQCRLRPLDKIKSRAVCYPLHLLLLPQKRNILHIVLKLHSLENPKYSIRLAMNIMSVSKRRQKKSKRCWGNFRNLSIQIQLTLGISAYQRKDHIGGCATARSVGSGIKKRSNRNQIYFCLLAICLPACPVGRLPTFILREKILSINFASWLVKDSSY